eukprot:4593367-Pleurochrysis_carterae.AAC.2
MLDGQVGRNGMSSAAEDAVMHSDEVLPAARRPAESWEEVRLDRPDDGFDDVFDAALSRSKPKRALQRIVAEGARPSVCSGCVRLSTTAMTSWFLFLPASSACTTKNRGPKTFQRGLGFGMLRALSSYPHGRAAFPAITSPPTDTPRMIDRAWPDACITCLCHISSCSALPQADADSPPPRATPDAALSTGAPSATSVEDDLELTDAHGEMC